MSALRIGGSVLRRAKIGSFVKDTTDHVHTPVILAVTRSFVRCSGLCVPRGAPRGGLIQNVTSSHTIKEEHKTRPSLDERAQPQGQAEAEAKGNPELVQDFLKSARLSQEVERPPEFPSDFEKAARIEAERRDQSRGSFRPNIDPEETSVLLFPGQGSQFVGMGKKLIDIPKVQEIFEHANEILGYDLLDICLNGPKEKLNKTVYCQPAVFVTSLAAVEKLKEENEQVNHFSAMS